VVYTHSHADHVHGIDDLRQIVFNIRRRLPVWADGPTQESLLNRFGYAFVQPANSAYPPILDMNTIDGPFTIDGAGGPVTLIPFEVEHGTIDALGFRIGGVAYLPDVLEIPEPAWAHLEGLDCWIVDALRRTPASHARASRQDARMDRAGPARPRGADEHAHGPRLRDGRGRDAAARHPGLRRDDDHLRRLTCRR
jgi:phosphoribosyl 1,2-cyclic phosphate phosphodiesterase